MKTYIFIIIISIYFINFILNYVRLKIVFKWMRRERNNICPVVNTKKLFLLIPVFNEQALIAETFHYFNKIIQQYDNVFTIFITTEKENSLTSTRDILTSLKQNFESDKVIIIHYPHKEGVMAHQLNYALDYIRHDLLIKDCYIGIYNIDSRMGSKTISYILTQINQCNDNNSCWQQYSWFRNPVAKSRSMIGAAVLWQNRWSITFEIYRVLYQNRLVKIFGNNEIINLFFGKMNYIIGHGFFASISLLEELGDFPTSSINEDAYLGLILCSKAIKIKPIPFLESADFAKNCRIYLKQQTVWFNGPLYAFAYMKELFEKNCNLIIRVRTFHMALKLFLHACYWLFGPIILYIVGACCISSWCDFLAWIIVILIQMPIMHGMTRRFLRSYGIDEKLLPRESLYCNLFYLVHCLGPMRGIVMKIMGKNGQKDKYKTER